MQTLTTDPKVFERARAARWSRALNVLFGLLGLWFLFLLVVLLLPHNYPATRGLIVFPFSLFVGIAFIILFVVALWFSAKKVLTLVVIGLTILLTFGLLAKGIDWGARANLALNRGHYETLVANIKQATDDAERQRICAEKCLVMSTNPLRVSFHYSHLYLSWYDLVYDASGEMNTSDRATLRKIQLYLYQSQPLAENWYLGHFGD